MAQPTLTSVHVNRPLTNISQAYMQDNDDYIAGKIFPMVPVQKQSDSYFIYTKDDWFRSVAQLRGPGTESAGGGYPLTTATYYAPVYAVHKDVDEQVRANSDDPLNADRDAMADVDVLAQCLVITGLVTILWWLCGYSLVFAKGGIDAGAGEAQPVHGSKGRHHDDGAHRHFAVLVGRCLEFHRFGRRRCGRRCGLEFGYLRRCRCRLYARNANLLLHPLKLSRHVLQVFANLIGIVATTHGRELAPANLIGTRLKRQVQLSRRHIRAPPWGHRIAK
jgi:hypothetical protein